MNGQTVIKMENVTKTYKIGRAEESSKVYALKGISFSIEQGEFVSIMGPSGSGKSTCMNMIGCLDRPSSGIVEICGKQTSKMNEKELSVLRNLTVGFVFQQYYLLPTMTVLENVMLPLRYQGISKNERKIMAEKALNQVQMQNRMQHRPMELSGGQKQRVAIARAIVTNPKIILADEPTGALDSATGIQVLNLFKQINSNGTTIVIVTHDPSIGASANRCIKIFDGNIESDFKQTPVFPQIHNAERTKMQMNRSKVEQIGNSTFYGRTELIEDFFNALQNFYRQKTRTILSLLGVIIGVASVIAITSIGSSSSEQIKQTFGSSGLDVVQISKGFMRRRRDAVQIQFDEAFRKELYENVSNIKKIWYKNNISSTISYSETSSSTSCSAIEHGFLEMYGLELEKGRFFTVTEDFYGLQKIILGKKLAKALFSDVNPVGKNVLVTADKVSFAFEVIGVLKEQNSGMENTEDIAYIPRGFYSKKIMPSPNAANVLVQVTNQNKATSVSSEIEQYCKAKTGSEYSVNVMSMQTMIEQLGEISQSLSIMLSGIAAISLLVGGIGIMNIMIVTVTERKQEIGIRKALGASPADICRQFLVESATITLFGGIIGIFAGSLMAIIIEKAKEMSAVINWNSCVVAFFFSVLVGIVFGLSPAIKAAKLDPVIALASE